MKLSSNRSIVNCGLTSAHDTYIQSSRSIKLLEGKIEYLIGQNNVMRELLGMPPLDEDEMFLALSETEHAHKVKNPFMRVMKQPYKLKK